MTVQRYFGMVVNFATVAVVSRLLLPEEIGLAVIGSSITIIAMSAREFASTNFLVQKKDLSQADIRAVFSVLAVVTGVVSVGLSLAAPWIAAAYGEPSLAPYLRVTALATFLEIAAALVTALMQRNMAFGKVAMITALQVGSGALATIAFAMAGFSAMSYAWAWLISAACSGLLAVYLWRDLSVFAPVAKGWGEMLTFSFYSGANQFLYRLYESLPYLFLGRLISMDAVGLYNRAMTLCQLPDKVFLTGVMAVGLSAFSAEARKEGSLKQPYLRAVSYMTALHWPALTTIAILAHPIVEILLGSQWTGAVPLVQIISLALLFSSTAELNYPVLVALGAIRATFWRAIIIWPVSAAVVSIAALWGLKVMALSLFFVVPFQAYVSIYPVRSRLELRWRELWDSTRKSFIVTLFSMTGPLAVTALAGFRFDLPIHWGLGAGMLAAAGWMAGLWLTNHPLLEEIARISILIRHSRLGRVVARQRASD